MGCCGRNFPSKEKIREAIKKNTFEFKELNPQTRKELIKFRDRALPQDLRNGVCRNLIEKKERFLCPLHPKQNNGKDLREGHCDVDYLCLAAKEFMGWSRERQKEFLKFIDDKELDKIQYSIEMGDDSLLKEFKSPE
jgi:hypothetical protein